MNFHLVFHPQIFSSKILQINIRLSPLRFVKNYNEWIVKNNANADFSFFQLFDENIKKIIYNILKCIN